MTFTAENLEKRKQFLTPNLYDRLRTEPQIGDPFTQTSDHPKAFRVGECRVIEPGRRVIFTVLLFWKTDTRSDQVPLNVLVEKVEDKWLVDGNYELKGEQR